MTADRGELRRQYRLERRLAQRLLSAPKVERRGLYSTAYAELFREFPQLAGIGDGWRAARAQQAELELRLLEPFLAPNVSMIEFGAGDGTLAARVAARVRRVWAVEAACPATSTNGGSSQLEWLDVDGPPVPLPDGCCGLVYSCHFVEHLHPDDLVEHLAEAHRLLESGGSYVCVTPNRLLGPHDVSKHFTAVATGLHLREYTHRELIERFGQAGFSKTEVLRKVGALPESGATPSYLRAERLVAAIPRRLRLAILSSSWLGRPAPFRPFEQVKVVAWK